jgi:hypothetical protein
MPTLLKRIPRVPLLLVIALIIVNSSVFLLGRTLLHIAPSNTLVPGRPYHYSGPILDWTTTVDPYGSLNVCYAFDAYTAHCFGKGIIPFWNPYQGLGQPFLADGLPAVFYPANWLHLVLPPAWWDLVFLLNWLLGALFLYCYLKLIEIERPAALFGALAVFGCGAIQVYLPLREVPAVAAWWPMLLYAVERTYRQPSWTGRHFALAAGVFCSIAGGQPEVTLVSLISILMYAALRILCARRRALALVLRLAPGAAAGLLLSAPHWLNFATYAFNSFSTHVPGAGNGAIQLRFETLASYLFPYFYGRVQTHAFGQSTGFYWVYSPGWAAPLCSFFALASIGSFVRRPRLTLGFLGLASALVLAKIFGVPLVHSLGSLPHLELVVFPRYASFLPGLGLAGLSAFGIAFLHGASNRTWLLWVTIWLLVACGAFALGLLSIWVPLRQAGPGSDARQTFFVFGLGGLTWALIQPVGLWWVNHRRPADWLAFYSCAFLGILLNAVAFAPKGYSVKIYAALSISGLAAYVVLVVASGWARNRRATIALCVMGVLSVAALPILAAALGRHGLNSRYNPLTPPPYLANLINLQEGGLYRSYSLDQMPDPDFACPFELTSLDNLDAICPTGTARFVLDYLDFGLSGIMFTGNRSVGPAYGTASDQIKRNRRYYDLVAVKYFVTNGHTLSGYLYDTSTVVPGPPHPVGMTGSFNSVFVSPADRFSSIEVLIGTYGRKNPGVLELRLLDESGTLIESSEIPSLDLTDNGYCRFTLSKAHELKGRTLRLTLSFRPASAESMVAAYVPADASALGFAFRIPPPEEDFREIYEDADTGAVIWENALAEPRVFLAPEIKPASSGQEALSRLKDIADLTRTVLIDPLIDHDVRPQPDPDPSRPAGALREFHLSPNEVRIKYSAELPGILTVTDSFSDGWHAEVNGKELPVLRVDGVFRGVRIETPRELDVRFWYRPPRWNLSLALCGLGALLLVGSIFGSGRPRVALAGNNPKPSSRSGPYHARLKVRRSQALRLFLR